MNPYLSRLREQYDGIRSGIEGLQTRAATEDRDLTETELRSIREQGETAAGLATQITELDEIETRNAAVAALGARVESDLAGAQNRSETPGTVRVGNASAQDRDPGHYRSVKDGGTRSFFSDVVKARYHQD